MLHQYLTYFSWNRMKRHFEPLAIASRVAQGTNRRGDQVLLLLGKLFKTYKDILEDVQTTSDADSEQDFEQDSEQDSEFLAILASLEKRWSKADQDFFITCLFLNPWIWLGLFNEDEISTGEIVGILLWQYKKVFKTDEAPTGFTNQVIEFKDHSLMRNDHLGLSLQK